MTQPASAQHKTDSLLPHLEDTFLWRLKIRLQFTGWLQFLPPVLVGVLCLIFAGIGALIGVWPGLLVWTPLALAAVLLTISAFDVVTCRLRLHPPESIPAPPTGLDALALVRSRVSCRSFQARSLTDAHRQALLAEAQRTTQAGHLLGDRPIRLEYIAAPLTVWPVVGAHEFFVAIAPKAYDRRAVIDVGRSLHEVVLLATRLGVATCWIGPGADQRSIVAHLGARFSPDADHVICVCAVGYRSRYMPLAIRLMQHGQHRRLPLSALFFADPAFQVPLDTTAAPLSDYGRCYELCQWAPSSYNSQTTRCAAVLADGRLARLDFAAATTSRYYAAVALGIWCATWEAGCRALGQPGHLAALPDTDDSTLPRVDVCWIVDSA